MTKNMNRIDRGVRFLVGVACIWVGFWDMSLISNEPLFPG